MHFKIIGILAAAAFLGACETAPESAASTGGGGGTSGGGVSSASSTNTKSSGPVMGSKEDFVTVGDRVFFALDKSTIDPASRATLEKQSAWLKKYPAVTISIEGHCDERGTREYNLALGERRANAVKDYLIALGVSPNRIKTISYGKERPVALGSNQNAWAQNRRGVTNVTGGAAGS
jgi:peptidoglycan-associated lipoprotein